MKRSLSSANYLANYLEIFFFFMNRLDLEQVCEKRLAFRWIVNCELAWLTCVWPQFLESRVYLT